MEAEARPSPLEHALRVLNIQCVNLITGRNGNPIGGWREGLDRIRSPWLDTEGFDLGEGNDDYDDFLLAGKDGGSGSG